MAVYYRYKSEKTFQKFVFEGSSITVGDLKKQLMAQNQLGSSSNTDLVLMKNEKEEYTEDTELIRNDTRVIVKLVSKSSRMNDTKKSNDSDDDNDRSTSNANDTGTCTKCNKPGHDAKSCPKRGDPNSIFQGSQLPRGIPRSNFRQVSEDHRGAISIGNGNYVITLSNMDQKQTTRVDKSTAPAEYLCPKCKEILTDPTSTPCCKSNYCDNCLRDLVSIDHTIECPKCAVNFPPEKLVLNRSLLDKIRLFKNPGSRNQSSSSQHRHSSSRTSDRKRSSSSRDENSERRDSSSSRRDGKNDEEERHRSSSRRSSSHNEPGKDGRKPEPSRSGSDHHKRDSSKSSSGGTNFTGSRPKQDGGSIPILNPVLGQGGMMWPGMNPMGVVAYPFLPQVHPNAQMAFQGQGFMMQNFFPQYGAIPIQKTANSGKNESTKERYPNMSLVFNQGKERSSSQDSGRKYNSPHGERDEQNYDDKKDTYADPTNEGESYRDETRAEVGDDDNFIEEPPKTQNQHFESVSSSSDQDKNRHGDGRTSKSSSHRSQPDHAERNHSEDIDRNPSPDTTVTTSTPCREDILNSTRGSSSRKENRSDDQKDTRTSSRDKEKDKYRDADRSQDYTSHEKERAHHNKDKNTGHSESSSSNSKSKGSVKDNHHDRQKEKEREKESSRSRDSEKDRQSHREKEKEKEKEKDTHHPRDSNRDRKQEQDRNREKEKEKRNEPIIQRESEKEGHRSRDSDRDRKQDSDKHRQTHREKDKDKDKEGYRPRDSDGDRRQEQDRGREKEKQVLNPRDAEKSKQPDKERERQREKDGHKAKESERDKERDSKKGTEPDKDKQRPRDSLRDAKTIREPEREKDKRQRESGRDKPRDKDSFAPIHTHREHDREDDRDRKRHKPKPDDDYLDAVDYGEQHDYYSFNHHGQSRDPGYQGSSRH